jgi:signal peptidase I
VARRWFLRAAWTIGGLAAAALLLRAFVGDVYRVESGSMAPTLWGIEGGEWVFVRYDNSPPARWELVVLQRPGESAPIVKRVAGLPGESVQVRGGDVLVRGSRLPPDEPRPPWIPLFAQGAGLLSERFPAAPEQAALVRFAPGSTELDARAVPRDASLGLLMLAGGLDDDYPGPDGALVRGTLQANDARLECVATQRDPGSQLRLGLVEQGDTFQVLVRAIEGGESELVLTRRNALEGLAVLASARFPCAPGVPRRIAFENRDNVLRVELEGGPELVSEYRENAPHASDHAQEGASFGPRAWLGGDGGRFLFERVRLARDLCYASRGAHGVAAPVELGPGEFFVLGDHSSASRDSRDWGTVRQAEIVGRPAAVVWPPARWRKLPSGR